MDGMMNLGSALTAFVCGGVCMYKVLQPRLQQVRRTKQTTVQEEMSAPKTQEQISVIREPLDFVWLSTIIGRMNQKRNRMNAIEQFLINAQLGTMGCTQRIKVSCGTADQKEGSHLDYTLLLDNEEQQQHLVVMAEKERAKIRTSLEEDVDLICAMRRYGVTQTVTLTDAFSEIPKGEG